MFGRKLNNMNDELYFVIRVWNFPHNDSIQYNLLRKWENEQVF